MLIAQNKENERIKKFKWQKDSMKKQITRRDFLKGVGVLTAGVATAAISLNTLAKIAEAMKPGETAVYWRQLPTGLW
ncbi:hypothetical protein LCGC14_2866290, partial [marine sediment metagenome]